MTEPTYETISDATILPEEMARYSSRAADDCALVPVYSRCWCIWNSMRSTAFLTERIQHGDNPEQSREFALVAPRLGDPNVECSNGHVREIEEWAAEVIRYAHPEPPAQR